MRTLAIGDIHGCNAALNALLQLVQPESADQIIFVGDNIDRGPASQAVINTLLELRKKCSTVFLRGNHEVMVLDARDDLTKANLWQSYGGSETLSSYGVNYGNYGPDWIQAIPAAHWAFLEQTARFFENDTQIFVQPAWTRNSTWMHSRTGCCFGNTLTGFNPTGRENKSSVATLRNDRGKSKLWASRLALTRPQRPVDG
jgi:Calcineurin-like phosphoesterase